MTRRVPGGVVLLGHPVAHSHSPAFQNAALRAAGIDLRYEAVDVALAELDEVLQRLAEREIAGNVTVPYKRDVFERCAVCTPVAARAQAVNTFWFERGALHGDNTDVEGFNRAVDELGAAKPGARVLLLGSGGAARAVCAAVADWPGAQLSVHARNPQSVSELLQDFPQCKGIGSLASSAATLVVNATSVGLTGDSLPMPIAELPRDADVMDLVYGPSLTAFVRSARKEGHRAHDGRGMLLHQGAAAFRRWFGVAPDLEVMRAALDASLAANRPAAG